MHEESKIAVNQPCVICGGNDSHLLHEVDYPEFDYPGVFALRQCEKCGLLFNSPRLDDEAIGRLYDGNYYVFRESYAKSFQRVAELYRVTVAILEAQVSARSVLEVGSAKGYLMALMQTRGWQVKGVEVSHEAARSARERFGVEVHAGTLESYVAGPDPVQHEAIVTTDVIEHVTDPAVFVRSLNAALRVGGRLLIGTPNGGAECIGTLGSRWLGFNPFHIYFFDRENLETLLQGHGFKVEQAYTYNNLGCSALPDKGAARKQITNLLRHTRMLELSRTLKFGLEEGIDRLRTPLQASLSNALKYIEEGPYFFSTADGESARRQACTGENLVVIAQKVKGL